MPSALHWDRPTESPAATERAQTLDLPEVTSIRAPRRLPGITRELPPLTLPVHPFAQRLQFKLTEGYLSLPSAVDELDFRRQRIPRFMEERRRPLPPITERKTVGLPPLPAKPPSRASVTASVSPAPSLTSESELTSEERAVRAYAERTSRTGFIGTAGGELKIQGSHHAVIDVDDLDARSDLSITRRTRYS